MSLPASINVMLRSFLTTINVYAMILYERDLLLNAKRMYTFILSSSQSEEALVL